MIYENCFTDTEKAILKDIQKLLFFSEEMLNYLIAYIGYESGFNYKCTHTLYKIFNKKITGYFFMTRQTAKLYHVKINTLNSFSKEEQLLFLKKYLKPFSQKLKNPSNLIGCLIDPVYINASLNTNVFRSKLQCRYPGVKGILPLSVVMGEINDIYIKGDL